MAKVKIYLKKGETIDEVKELLYKALDLQRGEELHLQEDFDDPALINITQRIQKAHEDMFSELLDELFDQIDSDFKESL